MPRLVRTLRARQPPRKLRKQKLHRPHLQLRPTLLALFHLGCRPVVRRLETSRRHRARGTASLALQPGRSPARPLQRRPATLLLRQACRPCRLRSRVSHAPSRNTAPLPTPGARPHTGPRNLVAVCPLRTSRGQDQRDGRRTTMTRKRMRKMTKMCTSLSLLFVYLGCRPMTLGKLGRRTRQSRYPLTRAATRRNRLPRLSNLGCRPVAGRGFRGRRAPPCGVNVCAQHPGLARRWRRNTVQAR